MFRTKTILMLAMVIAVIMSSYCPAAVKLYDWYWNSTQASAFYDSINTRWVTIGYPSDANHPIMSMFTDTEPNSAFWVLNNPNNPAPTDPNEIHGIACKTVQGLVNPGILNTPEGSWTITAPFTFVGPVIDTTQTMDPNYAPVRVNDFKPAFVFGDNSGTADNRKNVVYRFNDLKFQGTMMGYRSNYAHLAGKVTLTGPTSLSHGVEGSGRYWYLDAEVDASALTEIRNDFFSREVGWGPDSGTFINSEKMWFCGKWILDTRMYAQRAGCLGDADIQINGGGTPGLIKVSGVPTPWIDRRSGNLRVTALDAISRNAKITIDTTAVVASPLFYGTASPPVGFTAATPQCPGGKIYVTAAASPVTIRELWVNGSQKAPGTYYATDSANQPWFGTSGTTYQGRIVVTGGTTRDVTMAAVLDPGAVADANLSIYPASGLTKAFLEGYVLNIKAKDPIVTSAGIGYKFVNWTSSMGSGIANVNAAQTTLTVPTGTNITVTAHYVIAASSPSPADGATQVAMTTALDWTPALPTGTQDLYFGTNSASLTFIKHFANGLSHGATNAEVAAVVGPLADTTTYYWRVNTNGQPGATWQFRTEQRRPYIPNPANGATNIERITPNLSWNTGHASVTSWDVYFGSSQTAIANAANILDPTFLTTRLISDANEPNAPAGLLINTTYYWRVDEHNTYGTLKGFVWSFTTRGPLCMGIGKGDLNADCRVTFVDFALVASSFFND